MLEKVSAIVDDELWVVDMEVAPPISTPVPEVVAPDFHSCVPVVNVIVPTAPVFVLSPTTPTTLLPVSVAVVLSVPEVAVAVVEPPVFTAVVKGVV